MAKYDFDVARLDKGFNQRIIKGGGVTILVQIVLLFVQIVTTSLLAHILSPADFGLVALAAAFTSFIVIFKDLGLSMATIQREKLTHNQVSNLFWVNIGVSFVLALIVVAISPLLAIFYENDKLAGILMVSGLSLIIGGFTVQHQALIRREMRFEVLALIDVGSRILGSTISILWAYYTKSYWSLVFMPIMSAFLYCIGVWLACNWQPSRFIRNSGTMELIHFGKNMTHYGIVNYFARNADSLIIGKVASAADLGLYNRCYSLMLLPIGQLVAPLTGVFVSSLSRLQNDSIKFEKYYSQIVKILSIVSFAIVSTMLVLSDEIIEIFLGPQWEDAKKIFFVLCFAALWQPILSTSGWVLTSLNKTDRIVKWGYINSIGLVIAFFVGSFWGIFGVAISYSAYMWLIFIPNLQFAYKGTPISVKAILKTILVPFLVTSIISITFLLIKNSLLINLDLILRTAIVAILVMIAWAIYFFSDKNRVKFILNLRKKF